MSRLTRRFPTFVGALFVVTAVRAYGQPDSVYAPLRLYDGTWNVTSTPGNKQRMIANVCARVGTFFTCQQTVDGKAGALLIFLPREQPGHYITQVVTTEGVSPGHGSLVIEGDRWTYLGEQHDGNTTIVYRTTNVFTGRDRIHYELAQSKNGGDWVVTGSGDEVRQ